VSKLFVFHGADSKTGVSMLAQSAAELIAGEKREKRVLLVNLQGRYGAAYTGFVGENVEGLRHYLDNRLLNREEVLAGCRCTENLYVIGGVATIGEERYYQPEMSSYLLSELRDEFDLILADSGSEIDNGLALGSLIMGDELILTLTQQEGVLKRLEKLTPLYRKLDLAFTLWVCNRFEEGDPYSREYLCRRLNIPQESLFTAAETQEGRRAEAESRTLLAYRSRAYEADLLNLSNEILRRAGEEPIEKQRKKRWKSFI